MRYVRHEDQAINVLNDAFFKVLTNINKFDTNKEFKPWFATIVVNTALTHIKRVNRHKWTELEAGTIEPMVENSVLPSMTYDEMMSMIQTLSLSYRTVFNLYVIDGYKHEEIAQKLGITVSTSKSNLARAKANLRSLFANLYSEDDAE